MSEVFHQIYQTFIAQSWIEIIGLITGVWSGILLIQNKILTWPIGIVFVVSSLIIYWQAALYGDFILYIVFFIQYCYGWYAWRSYSSMNVEQQISRASRRSLLWIALLSSMGIYLFARFIIWLPGQFDGMAPASLPYWDSTTSVLTVAAMYLIARRQIENWIFLFVVDVLAAGIYWYKGYYYFSLLYVIYIGFAIWGYRSWTKIMKSQ